jgi:hypothetical protein
MNWYEIAFHSGYAISVFFLAIRYRGLANSKCNEESLNFGKDPFRMDAATWVLLPLIWFEFRYVILFFSSLASGLGKSVSLDVST